MSSMIEKFGNGFFAELETFLHSEYYKLVYLERCNIHLTDEILASSLSEVEAIKNGDVQALFTLGLHLDVLGRGLPGFHKFSRPLLFMAAELDDPFANYIVSRRYALREGGFDTGDQVANDALTQQYAKRAQKLGYIRPTDETTSIIQQIVQQFLAMLENARVNFAYLSSAVSSIGIFKTAKSCHQEATEVEMQPLKSIIRTQS